MKNFTEASRLLARDSNSPKNWHFFALTIVPETDTPAVLNAYGTSCRYLPSHWSFLRTDFETLEQITHNFGFKFSREGKTINHSFYTAIINPEGNLRTFWRFGGDLSIEIAEQIRGACAQSNPP